jgi:hypothetical protein
MKTITIYTVVFIPTQSLLRSYSNEVDADIYLSNQIDKENFRIIANRLNYSIADLNN